MQIIKKDAMKQLRYKERISSKRSTGKKKE